MGHQALFNLIGNVLIVWAALVGAASVVVHSRVAWWVTPMGRHLMVYMSVMAAVLVLSCVRILFGDSTWFQLVRLVVFIGVPIAMTQRLVLQLKARRSGRDAGRMQPADRLDTPDTPEDPRTNSDH